MKTITVQISDRLTESELKALRLFVDRVQELKALGFWHETPNNQLKIQFDAHSGIKVHTKLPNEDLFRSLLMGFRLFHLKKEPTNFLRILKILSRIMDNELAKDKLHVLKETWRGTLTEQQFNLAINGQKLTAELLLDLWLNAKYFHQDHEKQLVLEHFVEVLTENGCKALLIGAIMRCCDALFELSDSLERITQ